MGGRLNVRRAFNKAGLVLSFFATTALAGQSVKSLVGAGMPAKCANFAAKVSGSEGNFGETNKFGCLGAFQFCPGTFESYYKGSAQQFLNDPSAQVTSWTKYEQQSWMTAQKNGLTTLIGKKVCSDGKCATIDQSAILMACQFGCGRKGKLANYAAGGNCNARNVKDGNLVSVCSYLIRGAGYDASCFTGGTTCKPSGTTPQTPAPTNNFPTSTQTILT